MRAAVVLTLLFGFSVNAVAQDQETKLVNRLLRPNTELQNEQQGKKFQFYDRTSSKSANVRSYYVQDRRLTKNFMASRRFDARTAPVQDFHAAKSTAYIGSRNAVPNAEYRTSSSRLVRAAYDSNKRSDGRDFQTNKFEARGKSQKAIGSQNHAMTIDEVRELLNKNK